MISVPSYSAKGTPGEKVKLPEAVFGVKTNPKLIAQAVRVYLGNQRQASAKTKTRAEIKKTTAKMYRQKGTGRARHGSYSAPIFVGGGVAHGPDGMQNFKRKMLSYQSKKALLGSLSEKAKSDLAVVTGIKSLEKTKDAAKLIQKVSEGKEKLLVVLAAGQTKAFNALRNLKNTKAIFTNQLNTYAVIRNQRVVVASEAVDELTKLFIK